MFLQFCLCCIHFIPYKEIGQEQVGGALYYPLDYIELGYENIQLTNRLKQPKLVNSDIINNEIPLDKRFLYSRAFVDLERVGLNVDHNLKTYDYLKDAIVEIPKGEVSINIPRTRSLSEGNFLEIELAFNAQYIGGPVKIGDDYVIYGISKNLLEQWTTKVLREDMFIQQGQYTLYWQHGFCLRLQIANSAIPRWAKGTGNYFFCGALSRDIIHLAFKK